MTCQSLSGLRKHRPNSLHDVVYSVDLVLSTAMLLFGVHEKPP